MTDLPFDYPSSPTVNVSTKKCGRHDWRDGYLAGFGITECRRCGKVRDEVSKARNKNNRKRGADFERAVAKRHGGRRTGPLDGRADLEAFLLLTRHAPSPRQRKLLDRLADRHDLTGPQWAADIMLRNPTDPIGAVIEADRAWRAERIAEAQAAETPKPVARRKPGLPQSARDILAELQRLDAEKAGAA